MPPRGEALTTQHAGFKVKSPRVVWEVLLHQLAPGLFSVLGEVKVGVSRRWVQGDVGCRTRDNQSIGGRAWPQEILEIFLFLPGSGTSPALLLLPVLDASWGAWAGLGLLLALGCPGRDASGVEGEGGEDKAWGVDGGKVMGREGEAQMLCSGVPFLGVPEGHLALSGPYLSPWVHQEHRHQDAATLPFLSLVGDCIVGFSFYRESLPQAKTPFFSHPLPPTYLALAI